MRSLLDFGHESQRVPRSDALPLISDHFRELLEVVAVLAAAVLIAKSALSKAFAVHFEAPGLGAFAEQGLDAGGLLLQHGELRVVGHGALLHDGLLAQASRLSVHARRLRLVVQRAFILDRHLENGILGVLRVQIINFGFLLPALLLVPLSLLALELAGVHGLLVFVVLEQVKRPISHHFPQIYLLLILLGALCAFPGRCSLEW